MTQPSFIQSQEQTELFRQQQEQTDFYESIFRVNGSASSNSRKLAQCAVTLDNAFHILGWDKPLINNTTGQVIREAVKTSTIVITYQTTIDGKYHNDFKQIAIAKEQDKNQRNKGNENTILVQR